MTRTDSEFNEDWAYLEILDRVMRDEDAGRTLGMDDYLALFPAHDETVREVWRRVMSPEPATEEVIGDRYRIVRELGRGGQAIVYLAEDCKLGRQVALKVMRWVSTSGVNRQLIRLEREALAASRLDHPGICTVFDSGAQDGTCYIAMRLVEGEPLAKIIARARHETDITKSGSPIRDTDTLHRMATIVAKTASALSTAHESGIIHRDIKPGNLMITPSGDPVILDFGLARDEQSTLSTLTVTGDPMGTPAYMAPEQWRGEGVGPAADVWALGVVLFEATTLTRPFDGSSREALAGRVRSASHSDPRTLNLAIPADLKVIIDVALEKDPERRYVDAGAFAADLWRFVRNEPILARPISPWVRVRRWIARNRLAAALVLSVTTLVLGALGVSIFVSVTNSRSANALRHERNEKQAALDEWTLLSDLRKMPELQRERDALWPARPERVEEMDIWIARASEVREALRSHMGDYERVQARSAPYSSADQERDRLANIQFNPLTPDALRIFSDLIGRMSETSDRRARVEAMRDQARRRLERRRTWRFDSPLDESRHEALAGIVAMQESLDAWISEMQRRRDFAKTVGERSLVVTAPAWEKCAREIAASPIYKGLQVEPQFGLVPLGKDPNSGLQEFAHLQSGEPPARDEQGQLVLTQATGMVFVLVPAGSFFMGAIKVDREAPGDHNRTPYAQGSESPVREATIAPFLLSKYELTCGQWERMAGWLPKKFVEQDGLLPVGDVTWHEAKTTLTRMALGFPTEARWEYACRAGTRSSFHWGTDWQRVVEFENTAVGDDPGFTWKGVNDDFSHFAPVGSFKPNPWGLHDMGGNATEWCADPWIADYSITCAPDVFLVNERGERFYNDGYNCVLRGGHHARAPASARSSYRSAHYGAYAAEVIGLRPVRELSR